MTITLNLSRILEERLTQAAQREGVSTDEYAVRLLDQHLPPTNRRAALVALLQTWIDQNDTQEQQETGDYLIQALDEDRPSERKLFPPEMKGISW